MLLMALCLGGLLFARVVCEVVPRCSSCALAAMLPLRVAYACAKSQLRRTQNSSGFGSHSLRPVPCGPVLALTRNNVFLVSMQAILLSLTRSTTHTHHTRHYTGDWEKATEYLLSLRIWNLITNKAEVVEMLRAKVQEEGLRTYLFTYGFVYDSISLADLAQLFGLSEQKVWFSDLANMSALIPSRASRSCCALARCLGSAHSTRCVGW